VGDGAGGEDLVTLDTPRLILRQWQPTDLDRYLKLFADPEGVESGQRAAIEVLLALGLPVPAGIASLPYSRIPGERIGVGDRW
jgi:hypothetical protein